MDKPHALLAFFSPHARGQSKGNVKLTVDYSFVFHCIVFRNFVPKVAISIIYGIKDEVEPEYIYEYGTPDTVGWNLEFEVADIRSQPDMYETLINFLNDDSFPLKEEYIAICDFYEQLNPTSNFR